MTKITESDLIDLFDEWFEKLGFDCYGFRHNDRKTYPSPYTFSNEIFSVFPYYWGDCGCEFSAKEKKWHDENRHETHCFQSELRPLIMLKPENKSEIIRKFVESRGYSVDEAMTYCDCSYRVKQALFYNTNDHAPTCELLIPNFAYTPLNIEIFWYKYSMRDAYSNIPLTIPIVQSMMEDCYRSISA